MVLKGIEETSVVKSWCRAVFDLLVDQNRSLHPIWNVLDGPMPAMRGPGGLFFFTRSGSVVP